MKQSISWLSEWKKIHVQVALPQDEKAGFLHASRLSGEVINEEASRMLIQL